MRIGVKAYGSPLRIHRRVALRLVIGPLASIKDQREVQIRVREVPIYALNANAQYGPQFSVLIDGHSKLMELAESLMSPDQHTNFVPSFIDPDSLESYSPVWKGLAAFQTLEPPSALRIDLGRGKVFDKDNRLIPFTDVRKGDLVNLQLTASAKFTPKQQPKDAEGNPTESEEEEGEEKENRLKCGWNFRVWQMKVIQKAAGASPTPSDEMTCDL